MKIEQVKIKSFKSLQDFEGNFSQHHVLLVGENSIGKSSIIQFIEIALGKQTNIPVNATGEGIVITNINGEKYTFAVKMKEGKPVVTITSPNGLKDTSKGALANVVGAIDFDIDKFADLSKTKAGRKEQVDEFKTFLPQETINFFNQMEAKIKTTYDERASLNRMIKENEINVNSSPLINRIGFEKFEKVNTDSLFTEMQTAQKTNEKLVGFAAKVSELKNQSIAHKSELKETLEQIEALKLKAFNLKETLDINEDKIKVGEKYLTENKPIDLSDFEEKLKSANKINKDFEVPSMEIFGINQKNFEEELENMATDAENSGAPNLNPRVPSVNEMVDLYGQAWRVS